MLSVDLSLYAGGFIVGDFNYPDIQWTEGSSFTTSFSGDEQALANLFLDYNFFQFVDRPTLNANLLDLVFTNSPELLLSIDSGLPSDHYPVIIDIAALLKSGILIKDFASIFQKQTLTF